MDQGSAERQLEMGAFGEEWRLVEGPFGLQTGQMRRDPKLAHNGGWYNIMGEKVGWGDLDAKDFERIKKELQAGETFIVLSEERSFWNFVEDPKMIPGFSNSRPKALIPGIGYVATNSMYIVRNGEAFLVSDMDDEARDFNVGGMDLKLIPRKDAVAMLIPPEER